MFAKPPSDDFFGLMFDLDAWAGMELRVGSSKGALIPFVRITSI
jgi:hypothetical protein